MSDFKKLKVWRKGHALALNVHRVTRQIRGSDNAALRIQMLRSAMSVPTNIVEGAGQKTQREFGRFLRYALNSSSELEYHLILARDIKVISTSDFSSLSDQTHEVGRMLHGLINRIAGAPRKPTEESPGDST
jgi:four helix bundle protein